MSLDLRDERQADRPAIAEVIAAAFEGEDEVRLVERLRRDGDVLVALVAVAVADDAVVGHILFSPLTVTRGAESIPAVALAPLAVAPGRQGEGIGTALVREGLACCQRAGMALVVVLGDPAYYRRFGFAAATARPLQAPFSGEAFMALALTPEGESETPARVGYAAAFGLDETPAPTAT